MGESILYFSPVKLDRNSYMYGAEWNRLALPSREKITRGENTSSSFATSQSESIQQSPAQAKRSSRESENKALKGTPGDSSVGAFGSGLQPTLIGRTDVAISQRYLKLQQLQSESRAAPPGNDRVPINRAIREIKNRTYEPGPVTDGFCDVDGNPIGLVKVAQNGEAPSGAVAIASTHLVSAVGLDFVERRSKSLVGWDARREVVDEMKLAIRFSAIISREGMVALEKLAKQIIKGSPHGFGVRFKQGRSESVPNKEIKSILRRQDAFDANIENMPVHFSTNGKVELYAAIAPIRLVTADELRSRPSLSRFRRHTEFSPPPKRWVLRTSNELNEVVRNGFERLSLVLSKIFT